MAWLVELPSELNIRTVKDLHTRLSEGVAEGLELDASGVTHVGGLGLQLLLAAKAECEKRNVDFNIVKASDAFDEGVKTLGAAKAMLREEGA